MNRKRLVAVAVAGSLATLGLAGAAMAAGQDDPGMPVPAATAKVGPSMSPSAHGPRHGADDRGRGAEPGDDRGRSAEPGDDHGRHAEPGDDHGQHAEPGDDHGRRHGGHGSDD